MASQELAYPDLIRIFSKVKNLPFAPQLVSNASIASFIQDCFKLHKCGYFFWNTSISCLEVVTILWPPGSTSQVHDHRQAENLVIGLTGEVTVLRYYYSRNQRFLEWQEILGCGNPVKLLRDRYGVNAFNSADPWNETLAHLLSHRSIRNFLPTPLPDQTLETLVAVLALKSRRWNNTTGS